MFSLIDPAFGVYCSVGFATFPRRFPCYYPDLRPRTFDLHNLATHFPFSEPYNPPVDELNAVKKLLYDPRILRLYLKNKNAQSETTRRAPSQFWSLKICGSTNFIYFQNVVRRILKLQNCERARRASTQGRL